MIATRALLMTDVVDSMRLAEQLGEAAMSRLWIAHDRCARDLLQHWGGREIDKSDGFLLLFDQAEDALGYALAYQLALRSLEHPIAARAGIHVGDVTLRINEAADVARGAKPVEVEGLAKSIAARVMSAARGGQTLLSADARAMLPVGNTPELRSHGHWRLKGMLEPLELFEACTAELRGEPPVDGEKAWRVVRRGAHWLPARDIAHELPAELDPFVDRVDSLNALARMFDDGARLVCVHGLGGCGKTRLAQHFGWRWLGDFPGGVWFCDLSQARDLDGIAQAVARGLDVPLVRSDPLAQLAAAIAGRGACLLIADNFEQVSRFAQATIGSWLSHAPAARFLVTSRERLGIPGEEVLELPPVQADDAALLFRLRAAASAGTAAVQADEDRDAVVELVRLLDGLPLAIELAAARSPVMSARELVARMDERFKLLTSRHGRSERQSTLRATFDWSWDLLRPAERDALAQMSVFQGGATLRAIEAVIDLGAHAADASPLEALQSLVDKSLVRRSTRGRFELLPSVQDYAAECLSAAGRFPGSGADAFAAVALRHRLYYAQLPAQQAIADKCADLDNLVAAVRSAVAAGDVPCALGALEGAWEALRMRGPYRSGLALVGEVRAMPEIDAHAGARLDLFEGWFLRANGNIAAARTCFERAIAAAAQTEDARLEGWLRLYLAELDLNKADIENALATLQIAQRLGQSAGDRRLLCAAHNCQGNAALHRARLDEAFVSFERALEIARAQSDSYWIGIVLGNLGVVRDHQGRVAEARQHYEAALEVARAIGDRQREANTSSNLGLLLHLQGEQTQARERLSAALQSARELGYARLECIVRCNLALVAMEMRDHGQARALFDDALRMARELTDRRTEGQVLGYLGLLLARQDRPAEARAALQAAETLLHEVADRLGLAIVLCARAECEHRGGTATAAEAARAAASAIAIELAVQSESELALRLRAIDRLLGAKPLVAR